MKLFLTMKTWKEGNHFIAHTPELDLVSQGKTIEHAEKRLNEAVGIFIEESKRMGTLKEVLESLGFLKKKRTWETPRISLSEFEMSV